MTEPQHRADWFELFFDLVFVVTVSILAGRLHGDPGWGQYGTVLVLFFAAWWAWVNLVLSVNVFGARWTRTLLLLAMPGLATMAAAVPAGLGSRFMGVRPRGRLGSPGHVRHLVDSHAQRHHG